MPKRLVYAGGLHHATVLGNIAKEHSQSAIAGVSMGHVADAARLAVGVERAPRSRLRPHVG